jgi:hypothetical protein
MLLDATDFGLTHDGDPRENREAIQAAIDCAVMPAASAVIHQHYDPAECGTVYIPNGNYPIDGPIEIPSGILGLTIEGESKYSTAIIATGDHDGFVMDGAEGLSRDIQFRNFSLEGQLKGRAAFRLKRAYEWKFDNILARKWKERGIVFEELCICNQIYSCNFTLCLGGGVFIGSDCNVNTIRNSRFNGAHEGPVIEFHGRNSFRNAVTRNTIEGSAVGVLIHESGHSFTINENYFEAIKYGELWAFGASPQDYCRNLDFSFNSIGGRADKTWAVIDNLASSRITWNSNAKWHISRGFVNGNCEIEDNQYFIFDDDAAEQIQKLESGELWGM